MTNYILISLMLLQLVIILLIAVFCIWCIAPWLRCFVSGASVPFIQIIGMRMRRIPIGLIVDAYLALKQQGNPTTIMEIEGCYVAHKHEIHDLQSLMNALPKYQANIDGDKL